MTISDLGKPLSGRAGLRAGQRWLLLIIFVLIMSAATLGAVGPFLGRLWLISVICTVALAASIELYQRHVFGVLRSAMLRSHPRATVLLGQLARTSPAPATVAGFRRSTSITRNTWQAGISIGETSLETWAWDGRTPRRAKRIPRAWITSVDIRPAYLRYRPRDCLRIEWTDHGTKQWIELALIDLDCMVPRFMNERTTAQAINELIALPKSN